MDFNFDLEDLTKLRMDNVKTGYIVWLPHAVDVKAVMLRIRSSKAAGGLKKLAGFNTLADLKFKGYPYDHPVLIIDKFDDDCVLILIVSSIRNELVSADLAR